MPDPWPGLLPSPTFPGTIRAQPEDFQVEEVPAYLPSGEGAHLLLEVRKVNHTTDEVMRALARHCRVPVSELGSAGLKDKHALTLQWLSLPANASSLLKSFQMEGVEILRSGLHGNKLKTGHLKGNRFKICIQGLSPDACVEIGHRCEQLLRQGVPNYFGIQRFGRDRTNEAEGRALLLGKGRRHDRRTLRLMLSAVQSSLFNDVLARRLQQGWYSRVLAGDVLMKAESGGLFQCANPSIDQPRLDAFEVHLTGPVFGPKMKPAAGEPGELERAVLAASGIEASAFAVFGKLTQGTRRSLRLLPADLVWEPGRTSGVLRFTLPPGGYATTLLDELVDWQEGAQGSKNYPAEANK